MTGNKFRCCRNGSAGRASYMADNMVCDGCPPESSCSFFTRKPSGYPKASCFSLHFFLDWLFIFPLRMGFKGAAVASGLGQVLSFVILISHFVRKKGQLRIQRCPLSFALVGKICKRGGGGMCFPVKYAGYRPVLQLGLGKYPWRHGGIYIQCTFVYLFFCQCDPCRCGRRTAAALGAGVWTEG